MALQVHTDAYINGKWAPASSGSTFDVFNPATGEKLASVANCGAKDVNSAIDAASAAFQTWRHSSVSERLDLLLKVKDVLIKKKEHMGNILTTEMGKPLPEAIGEVGFGAAFFQWCAEESRRLYGEVIPSSTGATRMITIRQPVGVVGMITPWNFPIGMICRKVAAALACGNTCVLKPAEDTPLIALAFAEALAEAGVPPGLVNVVPCSRENAPEVGKALCSSNVVRTLSFTGSSVVGKILYSQCGGTMKKLGLELGGDAPCIVFPSANVDLAVKVILFSKFRNAGQVCIAPNRFLVHSSKKDEFVKALTEALSKHIVIGDGRKSGVTLGPLINKKQHDRLCRIVDESVKMGAKVVVGGKPKEGLFYEPTVLTGITEDMPAYKEELFGPVAPIKTFETEEEALRLANSTNMGLAGYFFTNDLTQSMRVAERLEVGMVGVNEGAISVPQAPFGGVKHSGVGKEGSRHGFDEFTDLKLIAVNTKSEA